MVAPASHFVYSQANYNFAIITTSFHKAFAGMDLHYSSPLSQGSSSHLDNIQY